MAGPAWWAVAVPVSTKMPVPMIEPDPNGNQVKRTQARARQANARLSPFASARIFV